jgi:hypothetical protein
MSESESTRLFIDDLLQENFTLQQDRILLVQELTDTKELLSATLALLHQYEEDGRRWRRPPMMEPVEDIDKPCGMPTWRDIPWGES